MARLGRLNRRIVAAVLTLAVGGGVGTGVIVHQLTGRDAPAAGGHEPAPTPSPSATPSKRASTPAPTRSPSPRSTPSQTSTPAPTPTQPTLQPLASLTVTPGAVGPVRVGMSRNEALTSGYLVADTDRPCEGGTFLAWRSPYGDSLDVITGPEGIVTSIGINGAEPRTRSGYGVGSTWGQLKAVVDPPAATDDGASRAFVYDNTLDAYIGFRFDGPPDKLSDSSEVTFMEVTKGRSPGLYRDGC